MRDEVFVGCARFRVCFLMRNERAEARTTNHGMSLVIRLLGPNDASLVRGAAAGVFDHAPQETLTAEFLRDARHHLIGALDEGRLIGFVSAVHYVHPDKPAELWINEIGAAPEYQGRGVGRQMLDAMLGHARELGCRKSWVLTDRENAAAMALYRGAGGAEERGETVMFEFEL
jgi:aminoglycoside 6'-N-acetyltransferase I